jgi:PQQ-dependent catabolism-associated CXXCW motif protein
MRWWILCLLILTSGLPRAVEAAERRVALIIGNDAYVKLNPLRNAGNDARKMEQALRSAGFETTLRIDAKRRNLYQVIDAFAMQIAGSPDTVGLFYYAGHGIQANGNNYLIPVDADIETEGDLEAEAVDAGKVLRAMAEAHNRLNIVVLDACRDNPLPKGRSASRGLARMDAPTGTFIAYAAGPGQTAQDGSAGGNGVFTGELVNAIALPGLPIEQVFKRAAQGVRRQTGDKQVPWTEASLQGDFFFHGAVTGNVIPSAPIGPAPAPAIPVTDTGAFELAYWNSVKDAKNAAEIKTYLDRYPKGTFAGIAKVKYDELQVAAATPPRVSPPLATPTGAGGRGWLGLQLQAVTPEQAEGAGLDPQHPSGGIAMDVEAGGPASRAGIQTGDALVRFDGRTIYQPTDLQRAVSDTSPGKTVDVGILRGGAPMTLRLTVGTAPAGGGAAPQPASAVTSLPSRPPNGFAGELEDFGVRPQSTLQFSVGSVTPTSIPGGRVITTEALTRFNRSALLIDAWADQGHATLPGAIRMPAAGTPGNFSDQIQAGFRQALAMRTNNNPQQPLVFFCAGAECWESYNAALRAVRLGYHEVYWYRGGVASWQAAGLPLYPP